MTNHLLTVARPDMCESVSDCYCRSNLSIVGFHREYRRPLTVQLAHSPLLHDVATLIAASNYESMSSE